MVRWLSVCLLFSISTSDILRESEPPPYEPFPYGGYQYVHPHPNTYHVSPHTTIGLNTGYPIAQDKRPLVKIFNVTGSMTGAHDGSVTIPLDGSTFLFTPDDPFKPKETVTVTIRPYFVKKVTRQNAIEPFRWSFAISPNPMDVYFTSDAVPLSVFPRTPDFSNFIGIGEMVDMGMAPSLDDGPTGGSSPAAALAADAPVPARVQARLPPPEKFLKYDRPVETDDPQTLFGNSSSAPPENLRMERTPRYWYRTVPPEFPAILARTPFKEKIGDKGFIFTSPILHHIRATLGVPDDWANWLIILDRRGDLVFYRKLDKGTGGSDFKVQHRTGKITYRDRSLGEYVELDQHYKKTRNFQTQHGWVIDGHGLQVLYDGSYLAMIEDRHYVNLTAINPSWPSKVKCLGSQVQHLDRNGQLLWQWRLWDHFTLPQLLSITWKAGPHPHKGETIWDIAHINSVDMTKDGNVLIGFRHFGPIKVDRKTSKILWTLGGKVGSGWNMFNVRGDDRPFAFSHDVRIDESILPHQLTVFDNGINRPDYLGDSLLATSRALTYDFFEKERQLVLRQNYRSTPDRFAWATGSNHKASNGNRIVNWGGVGDPPQPFCHEVTSEGHTALELQYENGAGSYRTFKQYWNGFPTWNPRLLVLTYSDKSASLHFSWNGATEVKTWKVFCGPHTNPEKNNLKAVIEKTHFEHFYYMKAPIPKPSYCRVIALNRIQKIIGQSENKNIHI